VTASGSLPRFAERLRQLPRVLAQQVAAASAPELSVLAQQSFDSSSSPDGVPWAPGKEGQKITLHETGRLEATLRYVAIGTRLRVALSVPYAKFQIGKRPIFPRAGTLPPAYRAALTARVNEAARSLIG
jgi:hypothetical protein